MKLSWFAACFVLFCAGCGEPSTTSVDAQSSDSSYQGTSRYIEETPEGPVDTRVSSHGKHRPTIAWSTEEELVSYYNPNTRTESEYEVEVDRGEDGHAQRINWPNSGWLEVDGELEDNGDGTCTHITDDGAEYTYRSKEGAMEDRGISQEDESEEAEE